jgi:hypothetical protein
MTLGDGGFGGDRFFIILDKFMAFGRILWEDVEPCLHEVKGVDKDKAEGKDDGEDGKEYDAEEDVVVVFAAFLFSFEFGPTSFAFLVTVIVLAPC